jgi:succinoglycan biosynthesis transport protein ExoP
MYLSDVLVAIRRRWATVLAVLVLALAGAEATLLLSTPTYQSTATMGLVPGDASPADNALGQIAVAAPLFTELAQSTDVRTAAGQELAGKVALGPLTVNTYRDTPLVFKLVVTSSSADAAQAGAAAYSSALIRLSATGELLSRRVAQVRLIGAPARPGPPVSPRPRETLLVAAFLGLVLGIVAAVLQQNLAAAGAVERHAQPGSALGPTPLVADRSPGWLKRNVP